MERDEGQVKNIHMCDMANSAFTKCTITCDIAKNGSFIVFVEVLSTIIAGCWQDLLPICIHQLIRNYLQDFYCQTMDEIIKLKKIQQKPN